MEPSTKGGNVSLSQDLQSKLGILSSDADELEQEYHNEPEFIEGLEAVAEIVRTGVKPKVTATPAGQPWADLYTEVVSNGKAPVDALQDALGAAKYAGKLNWALSGAVAAAIGHLTKAAKPGPGRPSKKRVVSYLEFLASFAKLGYDFTMNDLDDRVYVNGVAIDDATLSTIRTQMRELGHTYDRHYEDAMIRSGAENRFHPVRDYLESLTYDGGDYVVELASYFDDVDGVFGQWLRRWMIGAVARAYTGKQGFMLVLDGGQGLGKSQFAAWLCPLDDFFIEGAINPDDKDSQKRAATKWIWEVAELGSTTRRADREALKFFLTQEKITVRKPYDRYDTEKPALAAFIGTLNSEGGFLSDPTGSRRFVTANLTKIDWDYTKLDVNNLWAEAYAAWQAGEPWQLTHQEQQQSADINKRYEVDDPLEGYLLRSYVLTGDYDDWVPTTVIIGELRTQGMTGSSMAISKALAAVATKHGLELERRRLKNGQQVRGYWGITESSPLGGLGIP